ncbi:MAG TPA: zinc-binding alcohol dehydrogenase family protein [Tepidisphaeraceae bacterium]|jgi:NADPH2:quinone reductase|nr:zinc-binding alcohol dehydrogenase family protein [Tepidisphaeraceae bacterium]
MKAWLLDQIGAFDAMTLRDVPDPEPEDGEAVLDLDFAALNPADKYLGLGQYPAQPPMPHILGRDGVGTITQLNGPGHHWKPGDRAAILRGDTGVSRWGTFAQKVAVPLDNLIAIPKGWTDQQASCASLVYMTSYQAYTTWPDLLSPAMVLVTGASGGVGVASIQLGKAMGYRVIGLSRDQSKWDTLIEQGADAIYDPNDTQWRKKLKERVGERKFDLAIDNIGSSLFNEVLAVMGNLGRISCVGRLAGPVPEFNTASLFFRRLKIGGVAVGTYTNAQAHAAWDSVVQLLNKTHARPLIDRVFAFDELPAAFARLSHGPLGKVLLKIR